MVWILELVLGSMGFSFLGFAVVVFVCVGGLLVIV